MQKYTRDQHPISRQQISPHALKVLYRLHNNQYDAYLVGGCVRDLLLGIQPKDFDIVTNATPEQVKKLFKNCRLVGRRFRLAHILFGQEMIEVATFRAPHNQGNHQENTQAAQRQAQVNQAGRILRDNVYGTIEEDAVRRDFTINALYYNIADFAIYDFVNGLVDIQSKTLRLIGEPEARYREDPVRMLRTIRFATKLQVQVDHATIQPIYSLAHLLSDIPPARLFDECLKLFLHGYAEANFKQLHEMGLIDSLFPFLKVPLKEPTSLESKLILQALVETDIRTTTGRSVTPAFLFAAILWYPFLARVHEICLEASLPEFDAYQIAAADTLTLQARSVSIPKRFTLTMRDIWQLQLRFQNTTPSRVRRLLTHPKVRAGYHFLCLRAQIEKSPELLKLVEFWAPKVASIPETPLKQAPKKSIHRPRKRPGRWSKSARKSSPKY